eukprot:CAMPEP_0184455730 /NCGR_PEP_ID=MMETSP0740-20130409/24382_1 /TAXON_ID=385413 /ORGANISM="Thalassiosira miniscula, Strain CCMP1093" /LENGTH=67 /DNA_ID=CAMNT_0026827633 /DNA_START=12 /DNA_END=212 /DNA_ORIENTATION=+
MEETLFWFVLAVVTATFKQRYSTKGSMAGCGVSTNPVNACKSLSSPSPTRGPLLPGTDGNGHERMHP